MSSHRATASSDAGPQATSIHFHPACKNGQPVAPKRLRRDEAYLVPNFDQAEVLIAQGVNSARVAISDRASVNDHDPGYAQVAGELQLVPTSPFTFEESILVVLPTYNERANLEALVTAIGQYLVTDYCNSG